MIKIFDGDNVEITSVDFDEKYVIDQRWNVVQRAVEVLIPTFISKIVGKNVSFYDAKTGEIEFYEKEK